MNRLDNSQNLTKQRKTARQAVESAIDRAKLDPRATWFSLLSRPLVHVRAVPQTQRKVVTK
jgi:hypothetical protein